MKQNNKLLLRLGSAMLLALSATLTARADYPSTIQAQGAPAYFRLNETAQPAPTPLATNIGSLTSTANGTFVALPSLNAPGPFTGSVSVGLDGTAQYINTPYVSSLNTSTFSIEIWANPGIVPNFAYLASSVNTGTPRSGWYLAQDNGRVFSHWSAW